MCFCVSFFFSNLRILFVKIVLLCRNVNTWNGEFIYIGDYNVTRFFETVSSNKVKCYVDAFCILFCIIKRFCAVDNNGVFLFYINYCKNWDIEVEVEIRMTETLLSYKFYLFFFVLFILFLKSYALKIEMEILFRYGCYN